MALRKYVKTTYESTNGDTIRINEEGTVLELNDGGEIFETDNASEMREVLLDLLAELPQDKTSKKVK